MGLVDKVVSLFSRSEEPLESKKLNIPLMPATYIAQPMYTDQGKYKDVIFEAFKKNELVYATIMKIATSAAEPPLVVLGKENESVDTYDLLDLVRAPNPYMSTSDLWEATIINLYIAGNAYWYKERGLSGIVAIHPLIPGYISVKTSLTTVIDHYEYWIDGKLHIIQPEDMIHFQFPDPNNPAVGQSPLQAVFRQIDTDNEATDNTKVLLQNQGVPGLVFSTEGSMTQDQVERLKAQMSRGYTGINKGKSMILENGLKPEKVSLTPTEMAYHDLRRFTETRILMALAVPGIIMNTLSGMERSTFANYEEARKVLWEEVIGPLHRRLTSKIERDPDLNPLKLKIKFDVSEVPGLHSHQTEKFDRAMKAFDSGFVTINEARAEIGLEALPGIDGDQLKIPSRAQFITEPGAVADIPVQPGGLDDAVSEVSDETDKKPKPKKPPKSQGAPKVTTPNPNGNGKSVAVCSCHKCQPKQVKGRRKQTKAHIDLRLLRGVLGRMSIADNAYDEYKAWGQKTFVHQHADIVALLESHKKATFDKAKMLAATAKLQKDWAASAQESYAPIANNLISASGHAAASEIDISFDLSNATTLAAIKDYSYKFAESISSTSADTVRQILSDAAENGDSLDDIETSLKDAFDGMSDTRSEMIARTETIRGANEGARLAYKQGGITEMQWLTSDSDSCDYCDALDGTVVGVDESFVDAENPLDPSGDSPLDVSYGDIDTPPAHPNCRCTIIPVIDGQADDSNASDSEE